MDPAVARELRLRRSRTSVIATGTARGEHAACDCPSPLLPPVVDAA